MYYSPMNANTITLTDAVIAELEMTGRTACAAGDSAAPALCLSFEAMDAFADGYDAQRLRENA